jgi:BON domain
VLPPLPEFFVKARIARDPAEICTVVNTFWNPNAPAVQLRSSFCRKGSGATTADQQKMNPADRATTKQIRSALMQDKTLSTYAHNIKIITQDGHVTLKGPVRTEDEKTAIGEKAIEVAGAGNITNHLKIAPPTQ